MFGYLQRMERARGWLPDIRDYLPRRFFRSPADEAATEINQQFLYALQCNNSWLLQLILQTGIVNPNINFPTDNGATPLHVACANNNLGCVRLLLEHGADPSAQDYRGKTVLMQAVSSSSPQLVRELLLAESNYYSHSQGLSLLQYALKSDRRPPTVRSAKEVQEIVEILLKHGAGRGALKYLLEAWTDTSSDLKNTIFELLSIKNNYMSSCPRACQAIIDYLVQRCLISKSVLGRLDQLEAGVKMSGYSRLDFFVDCSDGEIKDLPTAMPSSLCGAKDGQFCLSFVVAAVLCQDSDAAEAILRYLQSVGLKLDIRDRHGFTAAFWAAALGRLSTLRFLLTEARCSASVKSHTGLTLAHLCSAHCPDEAAATAILQLISKRGGPLDMPDKDGRAPSQLLAERRFNQALRFLAGHRGCHAYRSLQLPDGRDVSLIGFAVQSGWEAEVRARLADQRREDWQRQRQVREQQHRQLIDLATEAGQRSVLEALLVHGFEFCSDEFFDGLLQRLLLTAAVQRSDVRLLNMLTLRFGADIDAVDFDDGETLLTRATNAGWFERVQLLLSAGARPERPNSAGDCAESLSEKNVRDERMFMQLVDLFQAATPELWPSAGSKSSSFEIGAMDISERHVTLFGHRYRVIEYAVIFSQPINLFRMSRRDQLSVLTNILKDIQQRNKPHMRLSMRALTTTDNERPALSADWPQIEYTIGVSIAKLRELLCQLHHLVTPCGLAQPINKFSLCVTAFN